MITQTMILPLIPFLNLLLITLAARLWLINNKHYVDWRQAILVAGVGWGLWITLTTELLSIVRWLQFYPILASQGLLIILAGWIIFSEPQHRLGIIHFPQLSLFLKFITGAILVIIVITGLTGVVSAPNNWDSMTYHLSRVMHWTQNRSVGHYATHELRQLYLNPWAEFAITNLQILSGNDRFANLVQWLSMVGSVLGVSFIARQLGTNVAGQILAALVTATIPMGILQAVTTQNDFVVTFWLICMVSFILSARQNPNWIFILGIAASLGLSLLTKGTAYLFATPFLVWFGLSLFKTRRWAVWQPILAIGIIALLINAGHYYRNYQLFDSPLKPKTLAEFDYVNKAMTPQIFLSNAVRSIALHLNTPLPSVNRTTEQSIQQLHQFLGVDLNDPRTTWVGTRFRLDPVYIHENNSGNFVHLILVLVAFVTIIKRKRHQKTEPCFTYSMVLTTAFLLFALYLKWQPWHSRLHLPLFVLWSPVIGNLLSQIPQLLVSNLIAVLLILQSLPFLLLNPSHPLIMPINIFNQPRQDQYFLFDHTIQEPYLAVVQLVNQKQCDKVGLNLPQDFWEYPFWVLLQPSDEQPRQIEAVEVDNESTVLQHNEFESCMVICPKCSLTSQNLYLEKFGEPALSDGQNFVYVKETSTE